MEIGNWGCGFVESHNLNLSSTSFLFISKFYNIFYKSFKNPKDKWQFAKYNQDPFLAPSLTLSLAFLAWPWPRDTGTNSTFFSLAKASSCEYGSTPGESTNIIGVFLFESEYTLYSEKFGGCTNVSFPFLSTIKLITAGRTRSLRTILVIISFLRLSHF